jgi:hypothetical protein
MRRSAAPSAKRESGMGTGDEQAASGTAETTDDVCASLPGWHTEEREHRRSERRFWNAYFGLTVPIVIGAVLSAFFAYRAYDTTLQALVEAKRQANAAEAQVSAKPADRVSIACRRRRYVSEASENGVSTRSRHVLHLLWC